MLSVCKMGNKINKMLYQKAFISLIQKNIITAWRCQGALLQLRASHHGLLFTVCWWTAKAEEGFSPHCPRQVLQGADETLRTVDFAADSRTGADSDSNKPFVKAAGKQEQRHSAFTSSCWTNLTHSGCSLVRPQPSQTKRFPDLHPAPAFSLQSP